MMKRRLQPASFTTSLLDLLSCAFGGVLVLSVVFSALIGAKAARKQESYLWIEARLATSNTSAETLSALRAVSLRLVITEPSGVKHNLHGFEPYDYQRRKVNDGREGHYRSAHTPGGAIPTVAVIGENLPEGPYQLEISVYQAPSNAVADDVQLELTLRYPQLDGKGDGSKNYRTFSHPRFKEEQAVKVNQLLLFKDVPLVSESFVINY